MESKARMFTFNEIRGKERARNSRYSKKPYTPDNTKRYEALIRSAYLQHHGKAKVIQGAVMMQIEINRKRPKKHYKKKKGVMTTYFSTEGLRSQYPVKTPDLSNIAKSVEDALNGIAYEDDRQIVHLTVISGWNDHDRKDEVHVFILPLEERDHGN